MTETAEATGPRASIRVRAALAAGLVLGITAGLTVASWTDAELVTSTFTASRFELETSVGGSSFSSSTPISVTVAGVYPGSSGRVFLPVRVRTTASSIAGSASLQHSAIVGATGLTAALRYRVITTSSGCDSTAFATATPAAYLVGTPTLSDAPFVTSALPATTSIDVAAAGASEVFYCFEFSLAASGLSQGSYAGTSTSALTWNVTGSS